MSDPNHLVLSDPNHLICVLIGINYGNLSVDFLIIFILHFYELFKNVTEFILVIRITFLHLNQKKETETFVVTEKQRPFDK